MTGKAVTLSFPTLESLQQGKVYSHTMSRCHFKKINSQICYHGLAFPASSMAFKHGCREPHLPAFPRNFPGHAHLIINSLHLCLLPQYLGVVL